MSYGGRQGRGGGGDNRGYQGKRARFLKPDDGHTDAQSLMRDDASTDATTVHANPFGAMSLSSQRTRLPVFQYRQHLLYLLEKYQTVVLVGETGSGKSTQLPQYMMETGWADEGRCICVTQPRRIAAVTLASRVADEACAVLGGLIGYCVRFDDCTSPSTKVKYVTDGLLLREMMSDPLLTRYSVVMVDEAHERSINTDLICALLKKVAKKRPDLRIVIASATLDAQLFRDYFNQNAGDDPRDDTAAAISIDGRQHPVRVFYTRTPIPDYLQSCVDTVMHIHQTASGLGDILVFLTGQEEVDMCCNRIRDAVKQLRNVDRLWILPMYGSLPSREQLKVFDSSPAGTRKVVLATNIAEASVTIPGVAYVVDCGFVKLRAFNAQTRLETLMTVRVSQSSAEQRAGRAGRIRAGTAYRLYTKESFADLRLDTVPEMQRSHLAPVLLQLKALGIQNVLKFDYLARPSSTAMVGGIELLYALGALDKSGALTELGEQMAEMPLRPDHAKMLLSSERHGCSLEIVTILAMLQVQDVFVTPTGSKHRSEVCKRKMSVEEGDLMTVLNVYTAFEKNGHSQKWCSDQFLNYRALGRARKIKDQLTRLAQRFKVKMVSCHGLIASSDTILRCVCASSFANAARRCPDGTYRTVREDHKLVIYKGSSLLYRPKYPDWVMFSEILADSMRDVSAIDFEWLYELAPHYYEYGTTLELDSNAKRRKLDPGSNLLMDDDVVEMVDD